MKDRIVVIGANSQLGAALKILRPSWQQLDRQNLNLNQTDKITSYFETTPDIIINFAAYTAVDKAEIEREHAMQVNALAVGELAKSCKKLIHISTDYVFPGEKGSPYLESDSVDPLNLYGQSKYRGEILAQKNNPNSIIVRTSWLYSGHGTNFLKKMLELAKTKTELRIVNDQIGTPTLSLDLVTTIVRIAESSNEIPPGVYHYSNEGEASWFDFAKEIFRLKNLPIQIQPISSAEFPTLARRPQYSVLDKSKIKMQLNMSIPRWEESLAHFLRDYRG